MLSEWLTMNVSNGEEWTVQPTPAPAQADTRRDGAMGNDCGLGAIYGLMYYIQHGRLASQQTCPLMRPQTTELWCSQRRRYN